MTATPELVQKYVKAVSAAVASFKGNVPTMEEWNVALGQNLEPILDIAPDLSEIKVILPEGQMKAPLTVLFQYEGNNPELWKALMLARVKQLEDQFLTVAGLAAGYRARIEQLEVGCHLKSGTFKNGAGAELSVSKMEGGGTRLSLMPGVEFIFNSDGNPVIAN